jgi:hypothetical protein
VLWRSAIASAGSGLVSSTQVPTYHEYTGLDARSLCGLHGTRGLKLLRVFIDSWVVAAMGLAQIGYSPGWRPAP